MALQSSGAISIGNIRTELGSSSGSLRTLSALAGKSTPDAISEFYGFSAATYYEFSASPFSDFNDSCAAGFSEPLGLYASVLELSVGDRLYTDSNLNTAFNGEGFWWFYDSSSYQIDTSGNIQDIVSCK
jgi:hypothetical protein